MDANAIYERRKKSFVESKFIPYPAVVYGKYVESRRAAAAARYVRETSTRRTFLASKLIDSKSATAECADTMAGGYRVGFFSWQ